MALLIGPLVLSLAALPAQGRAKEFPVFVWRQEYFGKEPPEDLIAPFGGTNVEGARDEDWVFERAVDFYVGHGPGRDVLHLERGDPAYAKRRRRWFQDRDPAHLVREPCLTDPATRKALASRLAETLAARGGRHGLGISLGDEVTLTPSGDPIDFCLSPTCRAAWRETWRDRTGSDEAPLALTDDVRAALETGDTTAMGPWLARRRFHRDVMSEVLTELAAQVRASSPGTGVGLLGIGGAHAFGGVDVPELLPHLDFVECYPSGDARELLFTLRENDQQALATVFLDETDPAGATWQLFDHWLRGGDGVVLWSDRGLLSDEDRAGRFASSVATLRSIRERTRELHPRPSGIAIVHSHDSVAASWMREALLDGSTWPNRFPGLQDERGVRERDLRTWLRLLEDTGFLPGSVPLASVGVGTLARFPLLVLNHTLVVSAEERDGLVEFLGAGGRVIVRGELGWIDEKGTRVPTDDLLARLLSAAEERVAIAPAGFEDYLDLRLSPGSGRAARVRAVLRDLARDAGLAAPPWRLAGPGAELPWLTGSSRLGGRCGWIVAMLPNLTNPGERAEHLGPLEVRVETDEGFVASWIHPPPRAAGPRSEDVGRMATVPAGEPLVFFVTEE